MKKDKQTKEERELIINNIVNLALSENKDDNELANGWAKG